MDTNTFNNPHLSNPWPDLHAASTLGGGTFGTVYACTKTDAVTGVTQKEAVKVVRVDFTPEDRANAEEEGIPSPTTTVPSRKSACRRSAGWSR